MNLELLKKLTDTPGVSGNETKIAEILEKEFSKLTTEIRKDKVGNIIAHIPGKGPKVLLIAHMDEVGFMVSKIENDGFVRVIPIGGIDPRVFYAQRIVIHGKEDIKGIVGAVPPHLLRSNPDAGKRVIPIDECFIDTGLSGDKVKEIVSIGDYATFDVMSFENEESLFAKALDDRLGCFTLVAAAQMAKNTGCDLYLCGSVQEEYGMRGAGPAAYDIKPDIAIALEGTFATDVSGIPAGFPKNKQGNGPEIRITDRAMISDRGLVNFLDDIAKTNEIPVQLAVKNAGGTDASRIQITGSGAKVTGIAAPIRYIHAPCGIVNKKDVESMVKLIAKFIEQASKMTI